MEKFDLITLNISNCWDPACNKHFWEAVVEVPDNYSLSDLHYFIQEIVGFDFDHLYDFYSGRNESNRKIVYSQEPGYPLNDGNYRKIRLKDIYPLNGLKLYYRFDFGDNWIFEIKKSKKKSSVQENIKYPRVVSDNGVKLLQYSDWDE